MWPGSDVQIQNVTINDFLPYDSNVSFAETERVANINAWFSRPNNPHQLRKLCILKNPTRADTIMDLKTKENMINVLKTWMAT
ncbi:unnamed protein product [Ranitomeya imitator]|uniref:Uncharacterized protein n=1 Tax=Ranitomeya imitator TaxID=111125 RepID=A0ABN9M0X2_9NEOB|nr:unnamed protein product [Ranitomeya imitator]